MELLYRHGGLNHREIGELMGVDYSAVSIGRKRFQDLVKQDRAVAKQLERVQGRLKDKDLTPGPPQGHNHGYSNRARAKTIRPSGCHPVFPHLLSCQSASAPLLKNPLGSYAQEGGVGRQFPWGNTQISG